ncbi:MAG: recombinase family protein, partial [Actinomycetota bacterium]|nr:recombinase family protein [Actinomycetota bacterium]
IAQFERAMTTQRTRRGRFQRAREGKVIGSGSPPYGFKYNEDRTTFVPDPDTMPTVGRMFELLAAGNTIGSIARGFEDEGLPTPNGGKHWYVPSLKRMVQNDVYKGIWWYGQNRVTLTPMGDKKRAWQKIDKNEWVGIPVQDSGIPHKVIDAARENLDRAYRPRKASKFDYELRGMVRCACCGLVLNGYSTGGKRYYRCQNLRKFGRAKYPDGAARNADNLEREVMRHVDSLLESPEKVRAQLDAAIEAETTRNPDEDAIGWLRIVEECDRKRAAYQDQQAAGYMTLEELGSKLAELNTSRATAQGELDRLQEGARRVEELRATKAAMLTTYKDVIQYDGVRFLPWEVRRELYEAMRLVVTVPKDGPIRVRCDVNQQVIRLSRAVEEWATEEAKYEGLLRSSQNTDKVMAEVAS